MPGRITTSQPIFVSVLAHSSPLPLPLQDLNTVQVPFCSRWPLGKVQLLALQVPWDALSCWDGPKDLIAKCHGEKKGCNQKAAAPCYMQIFISTQGQVENFSPILADSPLHFLLTPSVPHPSPSFRTRLPLLPVSICSLLPRHKLGKGSKFSHSLNRFQDEPPPSPVLTSFIMVKIIMNRNVEGENLLGIVLLSYMKSS